MDGHGKESVTVTQSTLRGKNRYPGTTTSAPSSRGAAATELEVEKQLGFKDKKDIENFGIENFN